MGQRPPYKKQQGIGSAPQKLYSVNRLIERSLDKLEAVADCQIIRPEPMMPLYGDEAQLLAQAQAIAKMLSSAASGTLQTRAETAVCEDADVVTLTLFDGAEVFLAESAIPYYHYVTEALACEAADNTAVDHAVENAFAALSESGLL